MSISRDEYAKAFSKRLRVTVADRNMTNKELAAKAEVNRNIVSSYLNGKAIPTAFVLAKLCVALGCDANVLLGTTKAVKKHV